MLSLKVYLVKPPKRKKKKGVTFVLTTITDRFSNLKITGKMDTIKLEVGQEIDIEYETLDRFGKQANVEGFVMSSSDETKFVLTPSADNPKAGLLQAIGAGAVQINLEADSRIGDGVKKRTGFTPVIITSPEMRTFAVKVGEVRDTPTGTGTGTGTPTATPTDVGTPTDLGTPTDIGTPTDV